MTVQENRAFSREETFPSYFVNRLQDFVSNLSANFRVRALNSTTVQVAASTGQGAASIGIAGRWRWAESVVSRSMPGGAAGTYSVFVVAANNSISNSPQENTDNTNYAFDLRITSGANPVISSGTVDVFRLVATVEWDGSAITAINTVVANADSSTAITPTSDLPTQPALRARGVAGQTADIATFGIGSSVLASIAADGTFKRNGVALPAGSRLLGVSFFDFGAVGANGTPIAGSITATPALGNSVTLLMLPMRFIASGGAHAFWGIQAIMSSALQGFGAYGSQDFAPGTDRLVSNYWTWTGLGTGSRTWQLRLENGNTPSTITQAGTGLMLLLENL